MGRTALVWLEKLLRRTVHDLSGADGGRAGFRSSGEESTQAAMGMRRRLRHKSSI